MEPLTGEALKIRVAELKAAHTPENEVAIACGYARLDGKANVNGLGLGTPKASRAGRSLGFRVKAGGKGQIVLSGGYSELIGVEPGEEVVVAHQGDTLVLSKPGAVPAACPAPALTSVCTYDSAPAQMAA